MDSPPLVNRQPLYPEGLFRALDIKGDLPQYIDPVSGTSFQLEDFSREEWSWLKRVRRLGQSIAAAASPGNFSVCTFGFLNALPQRWYCVVDQLRINNESAAALGVFYGLTDVAFAGGAGPGTQFDDRDVVPGALAAIPGTLFGVASNPAAATLAQPAARVVIPAGSSVTIDYPIVMTGRGQTVGRGVLQVCSGIVNVALSATLHYRLRELQTSEQ